MTTGERVRAEQRVLDECESCAHRQPVTAWAPNGVCGVMQIDCENVAMGLVEHMGRTASCARYTWNRMVKL